MPIYRRPSKMRGPIEDAGQLVAECRDLVDRFVYGSADPQLFNGEEQIEAGPVIHQDAAIATAYAPADSRQPDVADALPENTLDVFGPSSDLNPIQPGDDQNDERQQHNPENPCPVACISEFLGCFRH